MMKQFKFILKSVPAIFIILISFGSLEVFAQEGSAKIKDCCIMKDGKMVSMKEGIAVPMENSMTMANGTICMANGDCMMMDGSVVKLKEGQCVDMSGEIGKCDEVVKKSNPEMKPDFYTCSMHPEVTSTKPGKCPKCGMTLIKKEK